MLTLTPLPNLIQLPAPAADALGVDRRTAQTPGFEVTKENNASYIGVLIIRILLLKVLY